VKVLVLGGTRFVGRAIVERLLREGHRVTILNRGITPDTFSTRVRRVVGDRRDPDTLKRAVAKGDYDVIVDVNAYRGEDTSLALETFRNVAGHFIHISTAAVYLIREGLFPPFREEDFQGRLSPRPSADRSSWLYGYHKRRCEEVLQRAWEEDRFPATSLRLPMVIGPGDYTRRADAYLERLASGGPLLLPDGGLNSWGFLWVEDLAETVAANLANSNAFGQAYNLGQREVLSLRQFLELAAHALGATARLISIPREWLDAVGLGTAFSPFSHNHDILLDCRAAEEDLLFRSTPPARWMSRLVEDFRKRWSGAVEAFGSTRAFELTLAREMAPLRLPTLSPAADASR